MQSGDETVDNRFRDQIEPRNSRQNRRIQISLHVILPQVAA
jgi:hypothetical protein